MLFVAMDSDDIGESGRIWSVQLIKWLGVADISSKKHFKLNDIKSILCQERR